MKIILAIAGFVAVLFLGMMIVWGIPLFVTLTIAKWISLSEGGDKDDDFII